MLNPLIHQLVREATVDELIELASLVRSEMNIRHAGSAWDAIK